jgi:hypothetical protein
MKAAPVSRNGPLSARDKRVRANDRMDIDAQADLFLRAAVTASI